MLQVVDVPKVLVFTANHLAAQRAKMLTYAATKYTGASVQARGTTALRKDDLEAADVIVIMLRDQFISEFYLEVYPNTKVDLYTDGELIAPPPEPAPAPIPVKPAPLREPEITAAEESARDVRHPNETPEERRARIKRIKARKEAKNKARLGQE